MSKAEDTEELLPASKRYEDVSLSAEYVKSRIRYPTSVFETVMGYVEESVRLTYCCTL